MGGASGRAADSNPAEEGSIPSAPALWSLADLWCETHGNDVIYGRSAERDGRGTMYCSSWWRHGPDCRIIILPDSTSSSS